MKIMVFNNKNNIDVGSLVYSNKFEVECRIFTEWIAELQRYEYLLVNVKSGVVIARGVSITNLTLDNELELIEVDMDIDVKAGDLLYSHIHETYCTIFEKIDTGRQDYNYILIDIENNIELNQANDISALCYDDALEFVDKNSNLKLTNK